MKNDVAAARIELPNKLDRVLETFAYNVWMYARGGKNPDDNGPVDWCTDTLPKLAEWYKKSLEAHPAAMQPQVAEGDEELAERIAHICCHDESLEGMIINDDWHGKAVAAVTSFRTAHTAKLEAEVARLQGVAGELTGLLSAAGTYLESPVPGHGYTVMDFHHFMNKRQDALKRAKAEGV